MSRKPLVRSLATSVALAVAATGLITVAAGPASAATSRSAIVSAAVGQLGSNGCGIVNCGVQWCAYFSRWAWQQGGVDVSALGGTVTTFVNYGDSNGTWHNPGTYTPQPGDAMIFGGGNYPTKASGGAHVGIVEKVNANGTLTEIGGNQGGLVTEVTGTADQIEHYLEGSSSNFLGYVSPVGAGAVTPPPTGFADGTFVNVTETGQVYRIAGGAPIAVTDWNNVGGFQSYTTISQAQLNALPTVPADGTALAGGGTGGGIFVVAGGSPVYVSDFSHVPGIAQRVTVDQAAIDRAGTGGAYNHLRAVPADGTALAGGGTGGGIFVVAGGSPVYVSDFSHVPGIAPRVTVDQSAIDNAGSGAFYNHLRAVPADGTFLNDGTSGQVYRVAGGAPIAVTNWNNVGGFQPYTTVDGTAIGNAGSATFYRHLRQTPADGTVLRGWGTGNLYAVTGGHAAATATGTPNTDVDQVAIDRAGTGGVYNHLN